MGILLDGFWMLHHDMDAAGKKDAVLLALTDDYGLGPLKQEATARLFRNP